MSELNPTDPPSFDLAYVISDLHIGGQPGFQMFSAAGQFVAFIDGVIEELAKLRAKKKTARTLLVINGDFVDFLAEPGARFFNPASASNMLKDMFARKQFAPVMAALQKFVAVAGSWLVITLGNHDIELALPQLQTSMILLDSDSCSFLRRTRRRPGKFIQLLRRCDGTCQRAFRKNIRDGFGRIVTRISKLLRLFVSEREAQTKS